MDNARISKNHLYQENNVLNSTTQTVAVVTHQSEHRPQASPVAASTQQATLAAVGRLDALHRLEHQINPAIRLVSGVHG